jgi:hypothetical protein
VFCPCQQGKIWRFKLRTDCRRQARFRVSQTLWPVKYIFCRSESNFVTACRSDRRTDDIKLVGLNKRRCRFGYNAEPISNLYLWFLFHVKRRVFSQVSSEVYDNTWVLLVIKYCILSTPIFWFDLNKRFCKFDYVVASRGGTRKYESGEAK